MFGYFRPYNANLTHKEQQLFNSHYCRICYCLRIVGGQLARFCTTYDAAVYSLTLALQSGENTPPILPCERIGTKNLKHFYNDEIGIKFARLSLITFGEKFRDDIIDENGLKVKLAYKVFAKAIEKAKKAEPYLAENAFNETERINKLQNENASLLEIFGAYGDMAKNSFSQFIDMSPQTEELIRSISEYNFLVDMVVDYNDDYKHGQYNGLKKEGISTFSEYFDNYYYEFFDIANAVTERLVKAIFAVRDDSVLWNTLFKIIMRAVDTVIPSAILGEDVGFHYFNDLTTRFKEKRKLDKDIKRLGIKNEKN